MSRATAAEAGRAAPAIGTAGSRALPRRCNRRGTATGDELMEPPRGADDCRRTTCEQHITCEQRMTSSTGIDLGSSVEAQGFQPCEKKRQDDGFSGCALGGLGHSSSRRLTRRLVVLRI